MIETQIYNLIIAHLDEILVALSAIFVAFVSTMPETPPKTFVEMWVWVRETLQTVVPVRRISSSTVVTPIASAPTHIITPLSAVINQFKKD